MKGRWLLSVSVGIFMVLVSGFATPGAMGDVRENAFELGGFGGLYLMEGNQWLSDAPIYGGRIGYSLYRDLALEFSFGLCSSEYSITPNLYYNPPGTDAFSTLLNGQDVDLYHFRFELLYHFEEVADRYVPFLGLGAGMVLLDGFDLDTKLDTEITAGIGIKIFLLEDLLFRTDIRYVLLLDNYIKQTYVGTTRVRNKGSMFNNMETVFGLSYLLGGKVKDSDGDGITDDLDTCPETPAGVIVDSSGCPLDSDGDGVFDGIDQCPKTPAGAWVDNRGCPKDSDGDRVLDGLDKCPDTPHGVVVYTNGCPLDSDADGVFDGLDLCPNTPKGAIVNQAGCPLDGDRDGVPDGLDKCPKTAPGKEVDRTGCVLVAGTVQYDLMKKGIAALGITFAINSAEIKPVSHGMLDQVVSVLKMEKNIRIEVGGHTDTTGSAAYNKSLSLKRAESVMKYLVAAGVPASQVVARGYGESSPVASNRTKEGRAKNRRIEFKVIAR